MADSRSPSPEQQKEVDALLARMDVDIEKNNVHPIVKPALLLLQNEHAQWWPQGMPIEHVDQLKALIDETHKNKTILKAIADLLKVAAAVGAAPGGTMAGGHLLRLCENVIVDKNLMAMVNDNVQVDPATLRKVNDAIAAAPRARPPMVGDKPPDGSLRVDQIAAKRRL